MREIKFRVWDKEYQIYNNNPHIVINLKGEVYNQQDGSGGDNYIVEQYTGLKDMNNKDIYEGDLIQVQSKFILDALTGESFMLPVLPVEYSGGCYKLVDYEEEQIYSLWRSDMIVVGNIHEGDKR